MRKQLFIYFAVIILSGCAAKRDYSEPEHLAYAISEGCKGHAEVAQKNGYRYFAAYTNCINRTLIHLEVKDAN